MALRLSLREVSANLRPCLPTAVKAAAGPSRLPAVSARSWSHQSARAKPCLPRSRLDRRSLSTLNNSSAPPKFKWNGLTITLICVPLLTGALGVWQIQRLQWKLNLIEEVERNLQKEPMILPDEISLAALPDYTFRRVLVKGRFEDPVFLLGPRVYEGVPGYNVIQPFARVSSSGAKSSTILVNRGFVTTTRATAYREGRDHPPPGTTVGDREQSHGDVVIEALLKRPETQNTFQPKNDIARNEWYWADIDTMAEVAGGSERGVQAVMVDQIFDGKEPFGQLMQHGVPVGRPPIVELRNQHATYAATWLSLSALTSVMLWRLITKGRMGPTPKGNPRLR